MIIKLGLFLLLIPLVVFTASADQVTLKNGDRITGKVVKKDGATLTFKSDAFGDVTVPWEKVAQLVSEGPLTVVLPDGKSVLGKVTTTENKLEVTTETTKQSVGIGEVSAIRNKDEQKTYEGLEHPGLRNLWAGYADLGVSLARGNADTSTITTALSATRATRGDKTVVYFNQIYAKGKDVDGSSVKTAEAVRGGWAYNRNLTPRLFANFFNDYEYDLIESLDLRFVIGGGLGYSVIKNDQTQLDLLAGLDYEREKFSTPLTRNSAEAFWGDNLVHKFSKITALTQSFKMFNNLSELGEYRVNFDVGTVTALKKWLSWQLTASDRYLSNPIFGRKHNDLLFTTGIRVTFARQ